MDVSHHSLKAMLIIRTSRLMCPSEGRSHFALGDEEPGGKRIRITVLTRSPHVADEK